MADVKRQRSKNKSVISPYLLVILSFVAIIFIGAVLLYTPPFRNSGDWGDSFMDDLFTAVSATCVTGLVSYADGIVAIYNFWGQLVILIMIEVGGISFITLLTFVVTLFRRRMQMRNRYLLAQAVNANSMGTMVRYVRNIVVISLTIELIGAILLFPVFYLMYPGDLSSAIWTSIFQSVSSFCNAGFDILGNTSYIRGLGGIIDSIANWAYIYLQFVTMFLIVIGGISFLVLTDLFTFKKTRRRNRVLNKIIMCTSGVLLAGGFAIFLLTDCLGGNMTVMQCLFQSVTCRTAGFATYSQDQITMSGRVISCILMFIGGSPLSTAGGIKVTTIYLIALAIVRTLQGKKIESFDRKYSDKSVIRAMMLIILSVIIIIIGFIAVDSFERAASGITPETADEVEEISASNILFEVFSAFGTCGLSTGITPTLSTGSKITLCIVMFLGRIGPVTVFQVFNRDLNKEEDSHYDVVEANILIG
ncbi:MAG: hypothetical protein LUC16_00845 [Coprobacillus sp.]|nr:hypothetical protein [Coprobacillus sp.]